MPFKESIYDNQTAILRWLKSLGHKVEPDSVVFRRSRKGSRQVVDYGPVDEGYHERRSCTSKRRFRSIEEARATGGPKVSIYECKFCLGLHIATPKDDQ